MFRNIEKKINAIKSIYNSKKNKKGFTLIELIIVIAIIGILVVAAMMNMGHSTEDSRIAVAKEDARNLLSAQIQYYNETGDIATTCTGFLDTQQTSTDGTKTFGPYLKTCPTSPWNTSTESYVTEYKNGTKSAENIHVTFTHGNVTIDSDDLKKNTKS